MKVADVMTTGVCTCAMHDTLSRAAQLMWEKDCGAIPVVDDQGRTVGIVTDRDICMAGYTQGKPLSEIPVSVAAARSLVTALPDEHVDMLEARMQGAQVRRVPVLDGDGRPVGIVSMSDIARHVSLARRGDGLAVDAVARTLAAISQPRAPSQIPPAPETIPQLRVRRSGGNGGEKRAPR
jgi:CBS domain-containing protein